MFPQKRDFLRLATLFEGGLAGVAFAIGWLVDVAPLGRVTVDPAAIIIGMTATAPLLAAFALSYAYPTPGLRQIKDFLQSTLGPLLATCRWHELLYLALLAGFAEEILFRGVLQVWLERDWGWLGGLVFSNMIFALAHWITPLYGVLAGVTGAYLGWALDFSGERNLLVPIVIHALYDFIAFLAVARSVRSAQG